MFSPFFLFAFTFYIHLNYQGFFPSNYCLPFSTNFFTKVIFFLTVQLWLLDNLLSLFNRFLIFMHSFHPYFVPVSWVLVNPVFWSTSCISLTGWDCLFFVCTECIFWMAFVQKHVVWLESVQRKAKVLKMSLTKKNERMWVYRKEDMGKRRGENGTQ